jgi:hypothetical protein
MKEDFRQKSTNRRYRSKGSACRDKERIVEPGNGKDTLHSSLTRCIPYKSKSGDNQAYINDREDEVVARPNQYTTRQCLQVGKQNIKESPDGDNHIGFSEIRKHVNVKDLRAVISD